MTMTFIDKTEYINNDFRNSALIALGDMPGTRSGADEYFDKAKKAASTFLLRYRGKGRTFVKWMIMDFEIEGQTNSDGFMNIPEGVQTEIPWA